MPTNLYGPGDNYDLQNAHVLPALIRKFHEAKFKNANEVIVWGTGNVRREFMHVDDAAAACYFLMMNYGEAEIVNIGYGLDYTIKEMAELIKKITGFQGKIIFDYSKPDGTPRKLLNVDKINSMGWKAAINLVEGLSYTYKDFVKHYVHYIKVNERAYTPITYV